MSPEEISWRQRCIRHRCASPRKPRQYMASARWWSLEARRGYTSSAASLRYAANMRWAAGLARQHGAGTWLELIARADVPNPEVRS